MYRDAKIQRYKCGHAWAQAERERETRRAGIRGYCDNRNLFFDLWHGSSCPHCPCPSPSPRSSLTKLFSKVENSLGCALIAERGKLFKWVYIKLSEAFSTRLTNWVSVRCTRTHTHTHIHTHWLTHLRWPWLMRAARALQLDSLAIFYSAPANVADTLHPPPYRPQPAPVRLCLFYLSYLFMWQLINCTPAT